jgi:hypothetical protein
MIANWRMEQEFYTVLLIKILSDIETCVLIRDMY